MNKTVSREHLMTKSPTAFRERHLQLMESEKDDAVPTISSIKDFLKACEENGIELSKLKKAKQPSKAKSSQLRSRTKMGR